MIRVFQYIPAWNLPDISPYVTKLVNYLEMTDLNYELVPQPLDHLTTDAPHGKLPYIVDADGSKVADSTQIINYLKKKYGDPLDADMSAADKAVCYAWNKMLDEHFYWAGVIQPRWRMDDGWEVYIPYIVGGAEVGPELREVLDGFRGLIVSEFDGQGMGRRSVEEVYQLARQDIDAISDFLGDKPFFMGDKPRAIDADLYAMLRHVMYVPFTSDAKDYGLTKLNLTHYCERMNQTYNI